ncbi:hypothetical protein E3P81_03725 [Wallemia ichthyophaga]|nr:hypothetical protein E3P97_03733 [Wallemia ichthyophaga]TIB03127.1 hypothetical protein E3P96_01986 [Wallemia ichthyophaga]TIB28541.1 hypothetical protein E3P85_03618 [Wallemia ichthyophaga]TIB44117.1 hypothetical protein E3P82_03730 [Wallemia ichthyophaga]TIB46324.1 hypothetical protein E3P81_03725 [Wallemia ichthyophaga]
MNSHSEIFGYLSVLSWLCAQLPQVYKNHKLKTIEGLSVEFIITWLIGDLLNLLGCIYTNQLPFQVALSLWFILVDLALTGQYLQYRNYQDDRGRSTTRMITHRQTVSLSINRVSDRSASVKPPVTLKRSRRSQTHSVRRAENSRSRTFVSLVALGLTVGVGAAPTLPLPSISAKGLVSDDLAIIIGKLSSWACVTFYLSSRMPQIYYNYQRKSVEGLSVFLFLFALLGNSFYTMSILSSPRFQQSHPQAMKYLLESLPFLIGSVGTIVFDVIILLQVQMYKDKPQNTSGERQPLLDS